MEEGMIRRREKCPIEEAEEDETDHTCMSSTIQWSQIDNYQRSEWRVRREKDRRIGSREGWKG